MSHEPEEFSDLLGRLDAVERELLALAPNEFAKKFRLLSERDAVRRLIQEIQGDIAVADDRPTAEIEREIAALTASAAAIRSQEIDLVTQSGGGSNSGEMGNLGGIAINHRIKEASGYAAIQQRIGQLETILEQRSP